MSASTEMPDFIARCRGCRCAATRVRRQGVDYTECCWCGAVFFADGRRSPRRVKVAQPPAPIPAADWGDVARSPW